MIFDFLLKHINMRTLPKLCPLCFLLIIIKLLETNENFGKVLQTN